MSDNNNNNNNYYYYDPAAAAAAADDDNNGTDRPMGAQLGRLDDGWKMMNGILAPPAEVSLAGKAVAEAGAEPMSAALVCAPLCNRSSCSLMRATKQAAGRKWTAAAIGFQVSRRGRLDSGRLGGRAARINKIRPEIARRGPREHLRPPSLASRAELDPASNWISLARRPIKPTPAATIAGLVLIQLEASRGCSQWNRTSGSVGGRRRRPSSASRLHLANCSASPI